jgi:hypothetical protein
MTEVVEAHNHHHNPLYQDEDFEEFYDSSPPPVFASAGKNTFENASPSPPTISRSESPFQVMTTTTHEVSLSPAPSKKKSNNNIGSRRHPLHVEPSDSFINTTATSHHHYHHHDTHNTKHLHNPAHTTSNLISAIEVPIQQKAKAIVVDVKGMPSDLTKRFNNIVAGESSSFELKVMQSNDDHQAGRKQKVPTVFLKQQQHEHEQARPKSIKKGENHSIRVVVVPTFIFNNVVLMHKRTFAKHNERPFFLACCCKSYRRLTPTPCKAIQSRIHRFPKREIIHQRLQTRRQKIHAVSKTHASRDRSCGQL